MSSIKDLINTRTNNTNVQNTIKVEIQLDPNTVHEYTKLQAEYTAQLELQQGQKQKMNGPLAKMEAHLNDLKNHIDNTKAVIVLKPLTATESIRAASTVTQDDPMSTLWNSNLRQAYVRCETLTGNVVDDVTREDWAALLDTLTMEDLYQLHTRLTEATTSVFPT